MRIKRLLGIGCMMCVILINGFTVLAEEQETELISSTDENNDIATALRFVQIGEELSQRSLTKVLPNFKNLQQTDSRWSNEVMKTCGKTIGNSGCCLTSFTMIQQYYGGTDNPSQVNKKLGNAACPLQYGKAAELYGYGYNAVVQGVILSNYINYIKGAIDSGNPVLVGMSTASGSTHFVAAYGYDNNEIIISDPASRNYQLLSQYTNNGYVVNNLCTYIK